MEESKQTTATDFRAFLHNELRRCCHKNPSYSLRAFAKKLGVEPSALSKMLRGKRKITEGMLLRFCENLDLPPDEVEKYWKQSAGVSRGTKGVPKRPNKKFTQLSKDQFELLCDLNAIALLELVRTRNFVANLNWIAKRLGKSVTEVSLLVQQLCTLGALHINQNGKWTDRSGDFSTVGKYETSVILRRLQKQILKQAESALDNTPATDRDQSAVTFAIDKKLVSQAKEKIREFRGELTAWLESHGIADEVYQLSISFFPLTDKGDKQ